MSSPRAYHVTKCRRTADGYTFRVAATTPRPAGLRACFTAEKERSAGRYLRRLDRSSHAGPSLLFAPCAFRVFPDVERRWCAVLGAGAVRTIAYVDGGAGGRARRTIILMHIQMSESTAWARRARSGQSHGVRSSRAAGSNHVGLPRSAPTSRHQAGVSAPLAGHDGVTPPWKLQAMVAGSPLQLLPYVD